MSTQWCPALGEKEKKQVGGKTVITEYCKCQQESCWPKMHYLLILAHSTILAHSSVYKYHFFPLTKTQLTQLTSLPYCKKEDKSVCTTDLPQ